MAGRSLESLPVEVLLEVGTHLDKPSTVLNFMTLNSRLYALVKMNQERLMTDALANLVTPELLPQVLAVFEASKVESWTVERTTHTISQFKGSKYISRARLSVKDGLILQKRHENILPIINDFVEAALKKHPKILVEPKPLSKNERLRVERSFYRFELCANIFRQHVLDENPTCERCEDCKKLTRSSIIHVILFLFSGIELEQMVIITDFIQEHKHQYGKKWEWDITDAWMGPMISKAWTRRVLSFVSFRFPFILYRKTWLLMTDNSTVFCPDFTAEYLISQT